MAFKDLKAIETILTSLEPFDDMERQRILGFVISRLGLPSKLQGPGLVASTSSSTQDLAQPGGSKVDLGGVSDLAELMAAAHPQTDNDRALIAAAFLQSENGTKDLTGQQINAALKELGHSCSNITMAMSALMNARPALVIQTRKSGRTKQARKLYRVTTSGFSHVQAMVNGIENDEEP